MRLAIEIVARTFLCLGTFIFFAGIMFTLLVQTRVIKVINAIKCKTTRKER